MVTTPRKVLIAPASGAEVGGGHVMRQLALAEALRAQGAEVVFAVLETGADLLARFGGGAFETCLMPRSGHPGAIAACARAWEPDVLVLDDYVIDAAAAAPLGELVAHLVVVDDLANRDYACALLVDPGYGRETRDYAHRTPAGCRMLAGPAYAVLRRAFADAAQAVRPPTGPVEHVFVSFGLSDVEGVAARAVERLRPRLPDARFTVALASDAASLPRLRALAASDGGIDLHIDATDMATLMAGADIAVGAGGASTWERCALGLPSLAVVVADNQRRVVEAMAQAEVLLAADLAAPGFETTLSAQFDRLLEPALRTRLSAASRALCDGRGAERVAEAVLAL